MFSLRMARAEPCSERTKTLTIMLTVKPSKIARFKNTGLVIYTQSLGFTEMHFPTYLDGNCMFHLTFDPYKHAHDGQAGESCTARQQIAAREESSQRRGNFAYFNIDKAKKKTAS